MVAGTGSGLYRYSMPLGVASVTDTIVGSRDNGTIYYTPTAQVLFNRLTKEDQNEIKLLGATKLVIFAQLNQQLTSGNDVIICLGRVNGMELNPFPMVADYTTNPFDNGAFTNVSITTS